MNSTMNFYEILGVKQNATQEEIKQAYKKQMKKWHPDINKDPNAINMSSKINEAKEVLLDEIKRRDYDEYLTKKVDETYSRYTQTKRQTNTQDNTQNKEYEDNMMTKWEYLNSWLKYSTASPIRKIFGTIGVLLESFLCWIIKVLLITIAFICNLGSELLRQLFSHLSPILGLLGLLLIAQIFTNGFENFIKENKNTFTLVIVFVSLFISSFLLPILSRFLLSKKVFNILYNKIDINLFKVCVDYHE